MVLDEEPVAADRDRVGEREEDVWVEVLGIALGRSRAHEELARRGNADPSERAVVAGEQQHEVVEVPEPVVDRRRGQEHGVFPLAAEQALHRAIPGRVFVAQRVGLVDDDQSVGVLLGGDPACAPAGVGGRKLLVGRELLIGDHLRREAGAVDGVLPRLLELGGADDEREALFAQRVLLDEGQADRRLPGADAVGVENPTVAGENAPGALVAVALEGCELNRLGPATLLER